MLARSPSGEANSFVTLLTPTLGLVRARAQSVRRSGAKLSAALVTFAESDLVLVRGKEGWRVVGAVLAENWFEKMSRTAPRRRAVRVSGLLLRLVAGEAHNPGLFPNVRAFFEALAALPESAHDAAETLASLRALAALGLDAGEIPGETPLFTPSALAMVETKRASYILRINRGIASSGL